MRVLGIETTCDETAAAIVGVERSGEVKILSNEVLSQIAAHAAYGGVVPEIAARAHVEAIDRIVARAFETAGLKPADIDAVAAAAGPGLVGGVMVGLTTAKAIALVTGRPFIAVNHLEAHALTARLTDDLAFPYLLLLVSGGHTQLLAVRGVGDYLKLGGTIDDAVGEAFDKIAKMLGLPYPGGPSVEREAEKGDPERFDFPRPMAGPAEPRLLALGPQDGGPAGGGAHRAAVGPRRRRSLRLLPGGDRRRAGRPHAGRPARLPRSGHHALDAGRRRRRRRQPADPARADAACDRGRPADGRAAAGALRRQWRDDRLGRAGAAAARHGRRHERGGAPALAARRTRPAGLAQG